MVSYAALMVLAYLYSKAHLDKARVRHLDLLRQSMPRVSVIAAAKNEQTCILGAARSFLSLDYPDLEVVFVDDESTDHTFELLERAYELRQDDSPVASTLPHRPILSVWRSATDPRLVVVRKLSAGFKGDATNAALEIASGTYALMTDTDCVLEREAVLSLVSVVLEDPVTLAVGGSVHIVNGCDVVGGQLQAIRAPRHYFETVQVIEYERTFFMSRLGWSFLNMTPIISGALGLFRIDILRAVGGFRNVFADDMDMTFRIHRHIRDNHAAGQISFAPDAKAWTEAPPDYRSVASQRARWHNSLCDLLWTFRSMLFRPRYGRIGFILLPWFWIYELMAPVVGMLGWISIGLAAVLGCLNWPLAGYLLAAGYGFPVILSMLSILQSEGQCPRYTARDKRKLILLTALEVFPFRFLYMFWQLRGQLQYFRRNQHWQRVTRVGFDHAQFQKGGV